MRFPPSLMAAVSLFVLQGNVHAAPIANVHADAATCSMQNWPTASVVSGWRHGGASEKCFCAYGNDASSLSGLDTACPRWKQFISTDNATADKVAPAMSPARLVHGHACGVTCVQLEHACVGGVFNVVPPCQVSLSRRAVTLGRQGGNTTTQRYGYMTDWSVDFGSGYGSDCNKSMSPGCVTDGFHLLSTPRRQYVSDCCGTDPTSLVSILRSSEPQEVCRSLREMISGPLRHTKGGPWRSCVAENEDPVAQNKCLAQCFHFHPDVRVLHLHTTAAVKAMLRGPIDSALGPDYNSTQRDDAAYAYGRYNVCVCEPREWSGRGNCPSATPANEEAYVNQAVVSLCKNALGAAAKGMGSVDQKADWDDICQRCATLQ